MPTIWSPWFHRQPKAPRGRRLARCLPRLERLEPRTVPSFFPPVAYPVGATPMQPVIADFNNDGVPDVAVAVSRGAGANGYVAIFLADGTGGFTAAGTVTVGVLGPADLKAVDLTGNGNTDLVVTDWYDANVSVLPGHGDGTFDPPMTFATGFDPRRLGIGDFNGDGIPDLAVGDSGNGSLTDAGVSVLLGNGDGTFQPARHYASGVGDPIGVAVGDLNGDGYDDITLDTRSGSAVHVLLNNGDGTFAPPASYPVGNDPFGNALVDLNGDGILDIVTTNVGGHSVSVLLGNGDGTFAPRVDYSTGNATPEFPVVGDFNGDGTPDVAVLSTTDSGVIVLLGDGQGGLGQPMTFRASGNPTGVAAGDLNNDGYTDLVTTGSQRNTMDVLLNDGMWDPTAPGHGAGAIGRAPQAVPARATDTPEMEAVSVQVADTHAAGVPTDGVFVTRTVPAVNQNPVHPIAADLSASAPPMFDVFHDLWTD